jgi:hypothetical protein
MAMGKNFAWQPLTWSGVAAFAEGTLGRLLLVQLFFAMVAAGTLLWLLQSCWFPVVRESIRHLPSTGIIKSAKMVWNGDSPVLLAENRFVAIGVDMKHQGGARSAAHVQIEFGESDVRAISLLGFVQVKYPKGWIIPCNREELQPWWGAWSPILLGITAIAVLAGLFVFWAMVSLVFFMPIWMVALFADRALTIGGAWRMAGAAQLPGALLVIVALFFYGLDVVDPVRLLAALGVQALLSIIYAFGSPFRLPKLALKTTNPFETKKESRNPTQPENPFGVNSTNASESGNFDTHTESSPQPPDNSAS